MRVREALTNLIGNALKFCDKAERWIEIGCNLSSSQVILIEDNGIAERNSGKDFRDFPAIAGMTKSAAARRPA